ncbi:MAG TPA: hypothetical protein VE998_08540 [Terriglobales bacterium]|nr:hypothetical protein [Terriglobales bacterium]
MKNLPTKAKALVIAVILGCAALSGYAVIQGIPAVDAKFAVLLAMAVISARMKVKLPGIDSNMSMNLPFILVGLVQLTMPHAIVVGVLSTFVQCLPSSGQEMKLTQAAFNVCNMGNAIGLSFFFTSAAAKSAVAAEKPALLALAAAAFFLADTVPVAAIISAVEGHHMWKLWGQMALLTFPYFLLSAGVATMIAMTSHFVGFAWSLALPVMSVVFLSFRRYMGQVAIEQQSLHLSAAAASSAAD